MPGRQITIKFDTSKQNVDSLHKTLSYVLKTYFDCGGCGQVAHWTIPLGDPAVPPALKDIGVLGLREDVASG